MSWPRHRGGHGTGDPRPDPRRLRYWLLEQLLEQGKGAGRSLYKVETLTRFSQQFPSIPALVCGNVVEPVRSLPDQVHIQTDVTCRQRPAQLHAPQSKVSVAPDVDSEYLPHANQLSSPTATNIARAIATHGSLWPALECDVLGGQPARWNDFPLLSSSFPTRVRCSQHVFPSPLALEGHYLDPIAISKDSVHRQSLFALLADFFRYFFFAPHGPYS